jgi:subtilisin-like proprotein convertase family protein
MKPYNIIFTSILLVLVLSNILPALPTTANEAELLVKGWLKNNTKPLGVTLGRQVMQVETFTDDNNEPTYYVVYLQPSGFVIVPADDLVEPIICFANDGLYDPSSENPLGALVTNDLNRRIAAARSSFRSPAITTKMVKNQTQNKWNHFISLARASQSESVLMGLADSSISDVRVAPLIETKWDQNYIFYDTWPYVSAVYNYFTPPYEHGNYLNYACGCGATAMAQLMRYHRHPTIGIGIHDCSVKVDDVAQIMYTRGGDGSGGPYQWDLMIPEPDSDSSEAQYQAIGSLCYDAGIAAESEYGWFDTGTYPSKMKQALLNIFQYSNAILGRNRGSNIGPEELKNMINPNLDAGYPVILAIHGLWYGHGVVCDGYGYNFSTLYHHLNMGYSGLYDMWYALPDIDCSFLTEYDTVTECIYNVFTCGSGEIISGRITDEFGDPVADVTVTAQGADGFYITTTGENGIYAIVGVESNSQYAVTATKMGYNFASRSVSTGISLDYAVVSGNRGGIDFSVGDSDNQENIPTEYTSVDVPKTIPDLGTVTSILTVRDTGTIDDVNVRINIQHIWDEDLDVYLTAPDGTRIELFTDIGGMRDDFTNTILDDDAPLSITEGFSPFTGSFRPEGDLSVLDGMNINGTWMLEVTDDTWLISGDLNSWSLIVKFQDRPYIGSFLSTVIEPNKWPVVDSTTDDDTAGDEPGPTYSPYLQRTHNMVSRNS